MNYLEYKVAYRWNDIEKIRSGYFPFPKSLTIFPSEVCNLNCDGCHSKHLHKKNSFMDLALFKRIVTDFYFQGGKAVAFEGGGEPMLHPRIGQMIDHCKKIGLRVGIITNGTIYKKEMLLADWVRVSIHNVSKVLPQTKKNILRLMRNRTTTIIGVKFLRSKLCPIPLPVEELIQYVDYYQIKNLRNHPSSLIKNPKYVKPCGITPLRAVVDFNGTFYPCPFFPMYRQKPIGKGLLSNIWGSQEHKKAIKQIENCNLYDCPLLGIDWEKLKKADLGFI